MSAYTPSIFLARVSELAGAAVVRTICAEFGGTNQYIPRAAGFGCNCTPASTSTGAARRGHVRRLCLDLLDSARPACMTPEALLANVRLHYADAAHNELLRELDYLEARGLLAIANAYPGPAQIRLTADGMELAAAQHAGAAA